MCCFGNSLPPEGNTSLGAFSCAAHEDRKITKTIIRFFILYFVVNKTYILVIPKHTPSRGVDKLLIQTSIIFVT